MSQAAAPLRERIGIDFGARLPIEDGLLWAHEAGFRYVDVRLGDTGNTFASFDKARIAGVRRILDQTGLHLGLHTLSAVNMAETAAYLTEAVDEYLSSYLDLAGPLGAEWIVAHGGFHFTADYDRRIRTGRDRLERLSHVAANNEVRLLLENMNPEPRDAEVRYLASDVEECRFFFEGLDPSLVRWSFTVNHAHMLPVGVEGFYKAFGPARMEEVRLADNKGDKEEHLAPGDGTIDFNAMFEMIEGDGYTGHYMLAFGTPEDMRAGRDKLLADSGRA